jgi:hypothetical protein
VAGVSNLSSSRVNPTSHGAIPTQIIRPASDGASAAPSGNPQSRHHVGVELSHTHAREPTPILPSSVVPSIVSENSQIYPHYIKSLPASPFPEASSLVRLRKYKSCSVLKPIVIRFLHLVQSTALFTRYQTCRPLSLSLPSPQLPTPLLKVSLEIFLPPQLPLLDVLQPTLANSRSPSSMAPLRSVT